MRVIADQYIVFTDLRGLSTIARASPMSTVEKILDRLLELVGRVCRECGGTNRFGTGDAYCLTFPEPGLAMAAVERLAEGWGAFEHRERLRCPLNVVVHKGLAAAAVRKPTVAVGVLCSFRQLRASSLYEEGSSPQRGMRLPC
jgi:class 3 adenylate cyclase